MQILDLYAELAQSPEQSRNTGLAAVGVEVESERAPILRQLERILRESRGHLHERGLQLPAALAEYALELAQDGHALVFNFDAHSRETGIPGLLRRLSELGIEIRDLHSEESSLEDIFVGLVSTRA